MDDRRYAIAAKFNVTHEDLVRYGDTTIADALQRVPGVTVIHGAGKDFEIRLRGLGNGYTQILVNGEPVAPGFSIESISPELVDHIEVFRASTADMSSQAIAGTLNIVLKRAKASDSRSIKLGVGGYDAVLSPSASLNWGRHDGDLSSGLTLSVAEAQDHWRKADQTSATAASGPLYGWSTDGDQRNRLVTVNMLPQLSWTLSPDSSLSMTGFVQAQRAKFVALESRDDTFGIEPDFASDTLRNSSHIGQERLTINWKTPVGAVGRLDGKLIGTSEQRRSFGTLDGTDFAGELALHRTVNSLLTGHSLGSTGKFSFDLGETHTLGVGWDAQGERRSEDRIQRDTSETDYPVQDLDEDYVAHINRVALYVQDEWQATKQLSVYIGARGESLHTHTEGTGLPGADVDSHVVSPSFQALWKIPDTKSDQLRMSLNRTYKPPTARQLVPRRWVETQNSPTTPDFQGNPDLRPELAWGAEIGYEHYIGQDGFVGLNMYGRRISNVVVNRVYEDSGTWVATPSNEGSANVEGIELDGKGKLKALWSTAPDVSLRGGLTRNWSTLDSVPRPGNRLASQPKGSVNLGVDWRPEKSSWSFGSDLSLQVFGYVRSTPTDAVATSNKCLLNAYALWDVTKGTHLRVTATNLLRHDERTTTSHFDDTVVQEEYSRAPTSTTLKVQFETSF